MFQISLMYYNGDLFLKRQFTNLLITLVYIELKQLTKLYHYFRKIVSNSKYK